MMMIKQSGVALITVMLILSLATITAVSMVSKQNIDIHRSANILNFDQALEITSYLEGYANQGLNKHFTTFSRTTTTQADIDAWNKYVALGISFDEISGAGKGFIEDIQARFNLNSLVSSGSVVALQRTRLITLITNLNRDEDLDLNINFVDALIDWIDLDQTVYRNGAEDAVYTSFDPPYTAANQYLSDISELLLVNGIDNRQYKILKKYVCVLNASAAMNINTASSQVLRSLNPNITTVDADALHSTAQSSNKGKGFTTPAAFVKEPSIVKLNISEQGLAASSDNFDVYSEVRRNDTVLLYTSRINRDATTGTIEVIKRSRSLL